MLLIDADSLVYKAGWSVEKRFYTLPSGERFGTKKEATHALTAAGRGEELPLLVAGSETTGSESAAWLCLRNLYEGILNRFPGTPFVSFISEGKTFRHEVAKTQPYKGNRSESAKPYYYDFLRETILNTWNGSTVTYIEADDMVAIEASCRDSPVIVGIDKDLLQIPGMHYNYVKEELFEVDEYIGWRNFFTQVLVGDTTDNIPGLRGVGPKTALNLLDEDNDTWYLRCLNLYKEHYEVREQFDETCELLYLLRYPDDCWAAAREWFEAGRPV